MWTNAKSVHVSNRSLQCSLVFHYVYPDSIYLSVYLLTNVERFVLGCNRSRFLHVNFCWKALDEIYQIYMRPLGEKNRDWKWDNSFAPRRLEKFSKCSSWNLMIFHYLGIFSRANAFFVWLCSWRFVLKLDQFLSEFPRFFSARRVERGTPKRPR